MSADHLVIPYPGASYRRNTFCMAQHTPGVVYCTRRRGHQGRHAAAAPVDDWRGPWFVVEVWGNDVHADARRRGREKITALANARLFGVVEGLENGLDPDEAWAQAERIQPRLVWSVSGTGCPECGKTYVHAAECSAPVGSEPPC